MKRKSIFKSILLNFGEIISAAFLIIATIIVIANVFLRYVMNTGIWWTEEVVTGLFVWSVFLGSAAGYKRHKHIGVDFLLQKLPDGMQKIVTILVDTILIVINGYLTYLSIIYVSNSYMKPTAVLGISSVWISSSLLISFFLMTVYSIIFLVKTLQDKKQIVGGE
ncbi:MAG: TRAP transporter small permease [Clostridium sp.]|nr:TRAP transporter small permease [Clostridium sp.]